MDHMLYLSMAGAENIFLAQQSNTHNLANASTPGFKADLDALRSLPVYGPGHPTRAYAEDLRHGYDFRTGTIAHTGRALDVAVADSGWIAVLAEDGAEAYSRRGDLRIDPGGLLVNGAGQPVLGNGGPIAVPPSENLTIGRDGTISIQPLGQDASTLAEIDRIRLVDPPLESLVKGEDGLFRLADGGQAVPEAGVRLIGGAQESSNVNAVQALVQMIDLARAFEAQVKLLQVAERNDEVSAQTLSLR